MKIYKSTVLGNNQITYLIRLDKSKKGHNYLCLYFIDVENNNRGNVYKKFEDIDDYYIEDTGLKLSDLELRQITEAYASKLAKEQLKNQIFDFLNSKINV